MGSGWLLRDGEVLAALENCGRRWPESIQGGLLKRGPLLVETFSRSRPLGLAWCRHSKEDGSGSFLEVRAVWVVAPRRVGPLRVKGSILAAECGTFERWRLRPGDQLEIRQSE